MGRLVAHSALLPVFCADALSYCKQLKKANAELQGKRRAFEGTDPVTRVSLPGGAKGGEVCCPDDPPQARK